MQVTVVQTGLGPIPLWSPAGALTSAKPIVLAITGAWAKPDVMMKLPAVVGPDWDAAVMRLPGNGTPTLAEPSIEAWARAVSELIGARFAGRVVVLLGLSVGALLAIGVRDRNVRRVIAVEPPLVMSKLWPMREALMSRLQTDPTDSAFIGNVFGMSVSGQEARSYFELFDDALPPVDLIVGETPLYPVRPLERYPSFVDDEERVWLARRPGLTVHVAAGAGHAVHFFAAARLRDVLLASLDKALATAEP